MSGTDTMRGCNFQHSFAMWKALDLLQFGNGHMVLEGSTDKVDYEIWDESADIVEVGQIKTKAEPRQWAMSDLQGILQDWATNWSSAPQFTFVSDGSAGDEVQNKLKPIIQECSAGNTLTDEQLEFLQQKLTGIPNLLGIISRFQLLTRYPTTVDILLRIKDRLQSMGVADTASALSRLFLEVAITSEDSQPEKRKLSAHQVAKILRIDWPAPTGGDSVQRYRTDLMRSLQQQDFVALNYAATWAERGFEPFNILYSVRYSGEQEAPKKAHLDNLLGRGANLVIGGSPGAGKSTTLLQAGQHLLKEGKLVIFAPARLYRGDALENFLYERACFHSSRLQMTEMRRWLTEETMTLLIDGLDEVKQAYLSTLLEEIRRIVLTYKNVTVIASSRVPNHAEQLGFGFAEVQPLSSEQVNEIVSAHWPAQGISVPTLARRIGGFLYTPLAITMLAEVGGQELPNSRHGLFSAFVRSLYDRETKKKTQLASYLMVEDFCTRLAEHYFGLDTWSQTWSEFLKFCQEYLAEARRAKVFRVDTITAEDLAEYMSCFALLTRRDVSVEFLHSSFRDFFLSRTVDKERLPEYAVDTKRYECLVFWCSSFRGGELDLNLDLISDINVELLGQLWKYGVPSPKNDLRQYLSHFARAYHTLTQRHFPVLSTIQPRGIAAVSVGDNVAYVLTPKVSEGQLVDRTTMAKQLKLGNQVRLMRLDNLVRLHPVHAAYREVLDNLVQYFDARLVGIPEPNIAMEPKFEVSPVERVAAFLTEANAVYDQETPSVCPTLAARIQRPGDRVGTIGLHDGEYILNHRPNLSGAGPKIALRTGNNIERPRGPWVRLSHLLRLNPRGYAIEHMKEELESLLYGLDYPARWEL